MRETEPSPISHGSGRSSHLCYEDKARAGLQTGNEGFCDKIATGNV